MLSPDGLTWEEYEHPTLEDAQSYALKLNEWLGTKPQVIDEEFSMFFSPDSDDEVTPAAQGLLDAIDKLFASEGKLDRVPTKAQA